MNNQQIPVLVVSLPHAIKRRKFIREQMAKLKIDYEFFDAVDGNKLSHAYISKFKIKEGEQCLGRPLSKGELGCTFSHLHVYEKILAENIEKLIVLEDDAQLNDDFAALINGLDNSSVQWDLVYIGYSYWIRSAPLFGKNIYPLSLWKNRTLSMPAGTTSIKYRIGPFLTPLGGTYAYAITKRGAEQLIQKIKDGPVIPADHRLEQNRIKQRFAVAPLTVKHWEGGNIEQHIAPDRYILGAAHEAGEPHGNLKHRISDFKIKTLQKIHPRAPEYWQAAGTLRRRIKATLRFIRSEKPSLPYISSRYMNNLQIPVLIISLSHASKRRKFIREQMAKLKIDYKFFDAVDGDKLSNAYISKFKIKEGEQHMGSPLSKGELGCAFSHLQVYEKMLAENIEKLIVLEDDAQLNDDFAALINGLDDTSVQWDLVYIGYLHWTRSAPLFGKNIYPLNLWQNRTLPIPAGTTSIKYRIAPFLIPLAGAHAYAITKKGAEQLIQIIKSTPLLTADGRLERSRIKQRFAIAPLTVKQWKGDNIEQHLTPERDILYKDLELRSDLKHRISDFKIKTLQKIHPRAPECWQAAGTLRRRIKTTLRLIRSKNFPNHDDVSSP